MSLGCIMIVWFTASLSVAAQILFYLSSPNQRLVRFRLSSRVLLLTAILAIIAAIFAATTIMAPSSAIFMIVTLCMACASTVPLAAAWLRHIGRPAIR